MFFPFLLGDFTAVCWVTWSAPDYYNEAEVGDALIIRLSDLQNARFYILRKSFL